MLIAVWWIAVVASHSVIFPTPLQVRRRPRSISRATARCGITSARRCFAWRCGFLLAVAVGVPLGLFMGWVAGAYATLNPIFQILRPISPIAWIPLAILWFGVGDVLADLPDLPRLGVSD